MTAPWRKARAVGWSLAGTLSTLLLGGAAAFGLAVDPPKPVLVLDLSELPAAAPATATVAAVAEAAPAVPDAGPPLPDMPAQDEAPPDLPKPDTAPDPSSTASMTPPEAEVPLTADLSLPPKPEKAPVKTAKDPEPKEEPADRPIEKPKPAAKANQAAETAPTAGSKAKGGGLSPAAYAKAVMKKVRATRKKSGAGRGKAVIGFTIAPDGNLAAVQLLQGSGNAALDKIALDHIRRSAPFPAPPQDAGRSYSFEFIGK